MEQACVLFLGKKNKTIGCKMTIENYKLSTKIQSTNKKIRL